MTRSPRKFADLRGAPVTLVLTHEEPIDKVIMRLFTGSSDGLRVIAWMLNETAKPRPPNADDRALREAEGARRFVAEIQSMAQGSHVPHSPT